MSENINALKRVWNEFETQAVIKISDMRKLSDVFSKAMMQIERLEHSRDNWRRRCELAEKNLKIGVLDEKL
jgi:hypothetical protein